MNAPVYYHVGNFPPRNIDYGSLVSEIGPAHAELGRFDSALRAIPNPAVLLAPLTTQEAVLSSRIEGTRVTLEEVLRFDADMDVASLNAQKRHDVEEVSNYRAALLQAVDLLDKLPICNRLIKEVHETLLRGVRGHDKARGRFRTVQNYIAAAGLPIESARFVPIRPDDLESGMGDWERYANDQEVPDRLVQLAVIHAEFESLHPFVDGNGRLGRLIIPLFLFSRNLIRSPMFYLSEYLEANRAEYYDRLLAVSRDDDWTGWCRFFLRAIALQARHNAEKAGAILDLYNAHKEVVHSATHSEYALKALDFIFKDPIFNSSMFREATDIQKLTANRILDRLETSGVVVTVLEASGRRPAWYAFPALLTIVEKPLVSG